MFLLIDHIVMSRTVLLIFGPWLQNPE